MIAKLSPAKIWLAGGAAAAVLLTLLAWLLLIKPQNDTTNGLHAQRDAAVTRLVPLRRQLAAVRAQNEELAFYQAKLLANQAALPTESGIPAFLRALQLAGDKTGSVVTGIAVGGPAQVTAAGTKVYVLPIMLTVEGPAAALNRFLVRLQTVQSRAILLSSLNATPNDSAASLAGAVTMTIGMHAFVAPAGTAAGVSGTASAAESGPN